MFHQYVKNSELKLKTDEELRFNPRVENEPLRVLSEEDWQFWQTNGYVIVPNAVPPEKLEAVIELLWEFQEMNPDDPSTWYNNPARPMEMIELRGSGMVEVYHHQSLWNNRQHPRVYEAFVDIWGTEKLWVSIDRANLNPPNRTPGEFPGFIHWDIDTNARPIPANVQGVLALNEATVEMGGFQCVPELYRTFADWVQTQPADRDPYQPDITGFDIVKVPAQAGDLLIWNSLLPHGIRPNRSAKPRLAQYISMMPAQEQNTELRDWRVRSWRERIAPEGYAFPGDPRNWEQTKYERATLTELGEKLLGLRAW